MNIFICSPSTFRKAVFSALREDGHPHIVGVAPAPQEQYYDKLGIALRYHVPVVCDAKLHLRPHIPEHTDDYFRALTCYISDKALSRPAEIASIRLLLPRHRGRDAVRWTVACGDTVTGGTIYWLNNVVDGGPVLLQRTLFVQSDVDSS